MVSLADLWLPIVLSGAAVWIASALVWMVLPHHKSDYKKVPEEDGFLEGLGKRNLAPGLYMFPYCAGPGDAKDPEFAKKMAEGPSGQLIVRPRGQFNMGKGMVLSVLYNMVVALLVGYVARVTLPAGETYLTVFRVTGTVAILAYVGALIYPAIWAGRPWGAVFKEVVDGVAYGLITAGIFGWLWPAA
jgi:hypothetical protein